MAATASIGARATQAADVVLVSMPFGVLNSPSIALGILHSRLAAASIPVKTRHFTLDYGALVGIDLYNSIASGFPRTTDLLGEWLFSHAISRPSPGKRESYLSRTFGAYGRDAEEASRDFVGDSFDLRKGRLIETVLGLAAGAQDFVEYAAHEVLKHSPKVVGLTTVFQQNMASMALATRIRQLDPSVKIIVGGANCEGVMGQELARLFLVADVVVSGEADLVIVPLIQGLLVGERPQRHRALRPYVESLSGSERWLQTKLVPTLDSYPSPCFDDYFHDLRRCWSDPNALAVHIPLETSRGCWWGMKHHCTFCGLNGSTMSFRSRRPDDAVQEILAVTTKYPGAKICFVDNIMDYRYFEVFLPKLAQLGVDLDLFYEIKSNVTKPQVRALRDAGVRHVQPGIESLSDQVLAIMRKGVTAIQNIQLLKWCAELGIKVDWNLLWGFPREDPSEYQKMARLVPFLCHLEPPARGSTIRLDRFSPNFTRSAEFGFFNLRPYEAYYDVYDGASLQAVFNLSYFFRADSENHERVEEYTRGLSDAIGRWRACHAQGALTYVERDGRVVIVDSRPMLSGARSHALDPFQSKVFLLCDRARSAASILNEVPEASLEEVTSTLRGLCEKGVTWFDGEQYLSLALSFTTFLLSRATSNVEGAINEMLPRLIATTASSVKDTRIG